jgi:hypothetical protein
MTEHSMAADEGEYLDPGYDAETPAGDNVLNDFCRADALAWRRWAELCDGKFDEDPATGVAWSDTGSASLFANACHWLRPMLPDEAAAAVKGLRSVYSARPGGPFLLYSAFPTADLSELGMSPVGHPPMMIRPPAPRPTVDRAPTALRIEEVSTEQHVLDFERALVESFPIDDLLPWTPGCLVPSGLVGIGGWRLWVGYERDRPVATSAAFVADDVVDVTLVSCHPDARRRGYGEEMTWAATLAAPDRPAALIASDSGRPVYQQMGYVTALRFTLWIGTRT